MEYSSKTIYHSCVGSGYFSSDKLASIDIQAIAIVGSQSIAIKCWFMQAHEYNKQKIII